MAVDWDFVDAYENREVPWGPVGYVVYKRTYARRLDEGTEEWWQTVYRCCKSLVDDLGFVTTQQEIEDLYDAVFNLKCSFSGRALWQLGTDTIKTLGADSLQNCWCVAVDEPLDPFIFTFNQLMLGGGVGFNITPEKVYSIPAIKHKPEITLVNGNDVDFIVPDNREGWVQLLKNVLKSYFYSGKNFTYSVNSIRPKGEPISGFGGIASGPDALVYGIKEICKVLDRRHNQKLRPLDALDIMNIIGSIVVAGNVRRSAQIAIGDPYDFDFQNSKAWGRATIPNWRAMSNNTIATNRIDKLPDIFWNNYTDVDEYGNAVSEPFGLFNPYNSVRFGRLSDGLDYRVDPKAVGTNPCLSVKNWIHTSNGPRQVAELINKPFTALIGDRKIKSKGFFKTGTEQLFTLKTKRGYSIELTANHKLFSAKYRWSRVDQLTVGEKISLIKQYQPWGKGSQTKGWLAGVYLGDGTQDWLQFWDDNLYDYAVHATNECFNKRSDFGHNKSMKIYLPELISKYGLYGKKLTPVVEKESSDFTIGFLRGWFDADGTVTGTQAKGYSVRLCSTDFENLQAAQRMLARLGILSTLTDVRRPEGPRLLPDGHGGKKEYWCKATYELIISKVNLERYHELIGFVSPHKAAKLDKIIETTTFYSEDHYDQVVSIEKTTVEDVYDCTIPELHYFDCNGFKTHNCAEITLESYEACNLAEIYLPRIADEEEFRHVAELMYKVCKTISNYPFSDPKVNEVVSRNHRLGIGVTGFLEAPHLRSRQLFNNVYRHIEAVDKEYSAILGIKESIKLTTVKPSGTLSLLAGVTSGIHPAYSNYYIRRIRFASDDILVDQLKKAGYPVENDVNFDGTLKEDTLVVSFPVDHSSAVPASEVTAIQQLEVQKWLQENWSDNSVSVTIYYDEDELPEIREWLKENYDESVKTVSFLKKSKHGFKLAPLEEITQEKFNEMSRSITPLVRSSAGQRDLLEGVECVSGACPIK